MLKIPSLWINPCALKEDACLSEFAGELSCDHKSSITLVPSFQEETRPTNLRFYIVKSGHVGQGAWKLNKNLQTKTFSADKRDKNVLTTMANGQVLGRHPPLPRKDGLVLEMFRCAETALEIPAALGRSVIKTRNRKKQYAYSHFRFRVLMTRERHPVAKVQKTFCQV
jgi:hypothetical protein